MFKKNNFLIIVIGLLARPILLDGHLKGSMRHVCQCQNEVAMPQFRDQLFLSFSIDQALKNAANLLSRKQIPAFSVSSLNS